MNDFKKSFFEFIEASKTAYHTVKEISERLEANGYTRLYESEMWNLTLGGKYYVVRNGSSLIAFVNNGGSFMIAASHSDSPAFRVKGDSAMGAYVKLDTEKYGGLINYTWLDRPLTVAGRVTVKADGGLETRLADIGGKTLVIPSLAIHMNRNVNESCKLNPAKELLPLASLSGKGGELFELVASSASVKRKDIVSHELFLVSNEAPVSFGMNNEMVLAPRLDDLGCVYASLSGFLSAEKSESTPVLAVFDNEEVGSETKQGAASTFLGDTLRRIAGETSEYLTRIASSFMISADNAHALHPNYPEMADKNNAPLLAGGIVIKYNANQRYATDAVSEALFREICGKANVKVQTYYNRADLPGGSTLGSISDTKVSVPTVDIGIPQLAMHSVNECAALCDVCDMEKVMTEFFSKSLTVTGEKILIK
ncbi:MAG: M18 family aminopeptidase [Clostridia bacterium]|nr:M18 family aminopeptidase [Clostridia bacterium]